MKTLLKLAAVTSVTALMLVAVAACAKKGDEAKVEGKPSETTTTSALVGTQAKAKASCNMMTELGTCNEYPAEGRGRASFGVEKSLCEGFHGKFSAAGCSTDGQLGSCVMSDGEVKRYYGSTIAGEHALTVDEAKGDCESDAVKGRFTQAR